MKELNQVDLAFIVDTTGSMGGFINAAKAQMTDMLHSLTTNMATPINLRVGIVEYRDHPPQDRSFVTRTYPFARSLKSVQKKINKLQPGGGGDWPEAVYDGVVAVTTSLSWRPHSRKLAVLVGDAPPHGYQTLQGSCTCGLNAEEVSATLEEHGIVLYALGLTNSVAESFSWLAHYTGGEYFEAKRGNVAIEKVKTMLISEFSHLDFDKQVLNLCRTTDEWTVDDLCEQLEHPRGRVSASLSRLGRRHLLA